MKLGAYQVHGAAGGGVGARLSEFLSYRHLLANLVASDIRSRYRRSYLGMAWALLWPLIFSFIIAFVGIRIFQQPIETYVVYIITGIVIWDVVAGSVNGGTASFIVAEGYIRQYRLPYIIFPIRTSLALLVNSLFASVAAAGATIVLMPQSVSFYWLLWPFVLLAALIFAVPLCVIAAIANLKFRDFQHGIGLVMFLLWYLSPNIVVREVYEKPGLKAFTDVNPFASILDMFRAIVMERSAPTLHDTALVLGYSVVLWILAMLWLRVEGRRLIYYL